MKNILFIASIFFLISCKNKVAENSISQTLNRDSILAAIMDVDKSWSETAGKKGYNNSRGDFADERAINLMNGEMPLVGREAIIKYASTHPDTGFSIIWNPLKGDLSESCDLGYTYGSWQLFTKTKAGTDTTLFGNYITVWKRQPDGSWKYVIDGGGGTPREVKE